LHQDEYGDGEDCDREGKEADDEALPWDGILTLLDGGRFTEEDTDVLLHLLHEGCKLGNYEI
jgi:hypothetical protein